MAVLHRFYFILSSDQWPFYTGFTVYLVQIRVRISGKFSLFSKSLVRTEMPETVLKVPMEIDARLHAYIFIVHFLFNSNY